MFGIITPCSVCVNGMFYCNELEELEDGTCPDLPPPTEGAICSYEEREVPPTEFTVIRSEEDCDIWSVVAVPLFSSPSLLASLLFYCLCPFTAASVGMEFSSAEAVNQVT